MTLGWTYWARRLIIHYVDAMHHLPRSEGPNGSEDRRSQAMGRSVAQATGADYQEVVRMAETLTTREREILDLHDGGMRNVDISQQLNITAGTVSNALVKALKKLGRDSEIGNGGSRGSSSGSSAVTDPEAMFMQQGARALHRADETEEAVESYPADFETWLENSREELEKQYTATKERLVEEARVASEVSEKWITLADRLDIDLTAIAAEGQELPPTEVVVEETVTSTDEQPSDEATDNA